MNVAWEITASDVERLRAFVGPRLTNPFVQERHRRNLTWPKPTTSRDSVWRVMVGCLLTTQQPSGPGKPINKFLKVLPFPISYEQCLQQQGVGVYCTSVLSTFGGIRFSQVIGERIEKNLRTLEGSLWRETLSRLDLLRGQPTRDDEREVANFIDDHLAGFGPKQSRNLLQWLGLTRYEIPVDSRVMKWLNDFGFPLRLNPSVLSDRGSYQLILDGIQALCAKADIFPCILDAAIFASFDPGTSDEDWKSLDAP